ncbi:hypothetical protein [Photobacterium halotolerans]|uniref:hypothetical protein n=1 Tax=Photobacterium halotolerans TaxID=265726 RepID=UPI0012DFCB3D|nr:hypothetical protein [Photobacterium halotolerans]
MSQFIDELHEQYNLWVNYLNYTMAPWIFALAVGCFLGDSPQWLTLCCIAFICLWGYKNPSYPLNLIKLNEKRRNQTNTDYLYRGFLSKNMGILAVVTKMPLFLVSALFLAVVSVGITKSAVGL